MRVAAPPVGRAGAARGRGCARTWNRSACKGLPGRREASAGKGVEIAGGGGVGVCVK